MEKGTRNGTRFSLVALEDAWIFSAEAKISEEILEKIIICCLFLSKKNARKEVFSSDINAFLASVRQDPGLPLALKYMKESCNVCVAWPKFEAFCILQQYNTEECRKIADFVMSRV